MDTIKPVLHIIVVGFHHKKGCQVEFSYPPLIPGTEGKNECPSGWKYLPTLALPDGSHNFIEDSVFFNLPSLYDPQESIYGVSCYRQIPVEKLKIRTADVTRSTVQKSVCALISTPIYGYIEVKLSLIAHAYFDQGDFSRIEILVNAYNQLNACLSGDLVPRYNVGLPLRELILKWRHKVLILFKLTLLQKRVVCYGSPVRPICSLILGIVSLHSELLKTGFQQVACVKTSRPMSPMPSFTTPVDEIKKSVEKQEDIVEKTEKNTTKAEEIEEQAQKEEIRNVLVRETSVDAIASNFSNLCSIKPSDWNAPLKIFHHGNLCLPYLSLPFMDLLSDPSVMGYIIGASNVLFQQKRQLADVLVDVENAIVEAHDPELRRQMQLSTEDLRFVDFIIRNVQNPKEDAEGSEVWIREQFYGYMVAMLKASLYPEGSKDVEYFNFSYMNAWRKTQCYQDWFDSRQTNKNIDELDVGHPFAGNLSVADMKLRIAQTMQNSENGRKLNQAVNRTSTAVGGALTSAKGAISTWWTAITATQTVSAFAQNNNVKQEYEEEAGKECSENINDKSDDNNKNIVYDRNTVLEASEDNLKAMTQSKDIIEIGKEAEIIDKQKIFNV